MAAAVTRLLPAHQTQAQDADRDVTDTRHRHGKCLVSEAPSESLLRSRRRHISDTAHRAHQTHLFVPVTRHFSVHSPASVSTVAPWASCERASERARRVPPSTRCVEFAAPSSRPLSAVTSLHLSAKPGRHDAPTREAREHHGPACDVIRSTTDAPRREAREHPRRRVSSARGQEEPLQEPLQALKPLPALLSCA